MELDADKIAAFLQLSADGSFSKACRSLHLTQPALSKKIKRLEDELGMTLIIRDRRGLVLTASGRELIRYARTRQALDHEFTESIQSFNSGRKFGDVKIACYSSIARSAVLPCLYGVLHDAPQIHMDLMSRELHELPDLLMSGRADVIITTVPTRRENIVIEPVGREEFVHVRSAEIVNHTSAAQLPFLDHDTNDQTTLQFFEKQGLSLAITRNYYDDIYLVLDAVQRGLGQAVVSRHLVAESKGLVVVKHKKRVFDEVFLQYFRNACQTRLQRDVLAVIKEGLSRYLECKN